MGEFLSSHEEKAYEDAQGQTKIPLAVKLLVDDQTVTVRYNNAALANGVVKGRARGDTVQLRVFPRLIQPKNGGPAFLKVEGWVPRRD